MSDPLGGNSKEQLKSYISRIESLEEEKKTFVDDIRDVYAEAKSAGFDPKVMRAIVRRRKDPDKAAELEALIETYMEALGPLRDTPLGAAAINGLRRTQ